MENEKKPVSPVGGEQEKNHNHSHKRNRHGRRRGYFIDPAAKPEGGQAPATATKPETAEAKGGASNRNAQRSKQGGAHDEKKAAQKNAQKDNGAPATAPVKKESAEGGSSANRNRRRRNRRRSGKPTAPKGATTQTEQTAEPRKDENQQKKRRESGENKQKRHSADRLTPVAPSAFHSSTPADSEYEEIRFPADDDVMTVMPTAESISEEEPSPMVEVVGIRFKNSGKTYYFDPMGKVVRKGEYAIVETARGQEYGEVSMGNTMVKESDTVPPLRPILRVATEADKQHQAANKQKEEDAFRVCAEKIASHGLDMKLIDAQYTFDNSKLLFYFTSSGRVDFRELVKDLASVFRTRIELRQIGIRDEAKLMGGMGLCGRPLCCTLFLSDFGQVSIKMAKEQNLSLNSAKISGICGRLMCCLRYEHETYEYEIKRTPPVDSLVRTADGNGIVTEINPLVGNIKVRLLSSPDTPPKLYRREDVVMLKKKKKDEQDSN